MRVIVRRSSPEDARILKDVIQILNERHQSMLLSPNHHIYRKGPDGGLVKMSEEERARYPKPFEGGPNGAPPGSPDRLYGIQDAAGNWYYPFTSGFTVGWDRTKDEHVCDGAVCFEGYFPADMVRDADKMPVARVTPEGVKVVRVRMKIDPDDVDPYLFQMWMKRLGKNKMGLDLETGTYIGPGEPF